MAPRVRRWSRGRRIFSRGHTRCLTFRVQYFGSSCVCYGVSFAITTVVQAKVFTDNSGAAAQVPVLLTENGVCGPLLDYLLRMSGRSRAWQRNLLRAVRLLLDYAAANAGCFANEREARIETGLQRFERALTEDGTERHPTAALPRPRVRHTRAATDNSRPENFGLQLWTKVSQPAHCDAVAQKLWIERWDKRWRAQRTLSPGDTIGAQRRCLSCALTGVALPREPAPSVVGMRCTARS